MRDWGSIPGSGRSPGGGNGTPRQYSCLENPMDRGIWRATVHGVTKNQTWLKGLRHTGMTGRSRWKLHPRVDSREVPVAGPSQPHSALCWQTQAPSPSHIPGHVLFPVQNLLLSTSLQSVFLTHWLLMINQHMLALTEASKEGPAHSRNSEKPDAITGLPSPSAALESFQSYCFHMDGQPALSLTPLEVFHQTGDKDVAVSVVHPQKEKCPFSFWTFSFPHIQTSCLARQHLLCLSRNIKITHMVPSHIRSALGRDAPEDNATGRNHHDSCVCFSEMDEDMQWLFRRGKTQPDPLAASHTETHPAAWGSELETTQKSEVGERPLRDEYKYLPFKLPPKGLT